MRDNYILFRNYDRHVCFCIFFRCMKLYRLDVEQFLLVTSLCFPRTVFLHINILITFLPCFYRTTAFIQALASYLYYYNNVSTWINFFIYYDFQLMAMYRSSAKDFLLFNLICDCIQCLAGWILFIYRLKSLKPI